MRRVIGLSSGTNEPIAVKFNHIPGRWWRAAGSQSLASLMFAYRARRVNAELEKL
jgi:hypothetical protein